MQTVIAVVEPDTTDLVIRWAYEEAVARGFDLRVVQSLTARPGSGDPGGSVPPGDGPAVVRRALEGMRAAVLRSAREHDRVARRPSVSFHLLSTKGRLDAMPAPRSPSPELTVDADDVIVVAADPRTGRSPVLPHLLANGSGPRVLLWREAASPARPAARTIRTGGRGAVPAVVAAAARRSTADGSRPAAWVSPAQGKDQPAPERDSELSEERSWFAAHVL